MVRERIYEELMLEESLQKIVRLVIAIERTAIFDGAGADDWCVGVFLNKPLPKSCIIDSERDGVKIVVRVLQSWIQSNVACPA